MSVQRAQKRHETARRIERAALLLMARETFDYVTVNDIAAAAGVSRATVYRHFASKEDIVFANHPREIEALRDALRRHPEAIHNRQEMASAIVAFIQWLETQAADVELRLQIVDSTEQLKTRALHTRAALADTIAAELAGGHEPALDTRVLAAALVAALQHTVRQWRFAGHENELHPILMEALSVIAFADPQEDETEA